MGLSDEHVRAVLGEQERWDLVVGYFLAGELSLSRTAALLGSTYVDLLDRLQRLGLPTRQGTETIEDALNDACVAGEWQVTPT